MAERRPKNDGSVLPDRLLGNRARGHGLALLLLLAVGAACNFNATPGPSTGPGLEPPGSGEPNADTTGSSDAIGDKAGDSERPTTAGTGGVPAPPPTMIPGVAGQGGTGGTPPDEGTAGGSPEGTPVDGGCDGPLHIAVAPDRNTALPWTLLPIPTCRYTLPADAAPFVPDRVALRYSVGGQVTEVPRVADAAACDPAIGGWYYDATAAPATIVVCPKSCRDTAADVVLTCPSTKSF
jgi:hypothetical protein